MSIIQWDDSTEQEPIIFTSGRGLKGEYYMGKVSIGFCVSLDRTLGRGTAFIGNGKTLDEAKKVAEEFDTTNQVLTP